MDKAQYSPAISDRKKFKKKMLLLKVTLFLYCLVSIYICIENYKIEGTLIQSILKIRKKFTVDQYQNISSVSSFKELPFSILIISDD